MAVSNQLVGVVVCALLVIALWMSPTGNPSHGRQFSDTDSKLQALMDQVQSLRNVLVTSPPPAPLPTVPPRPPTPVHHEVLARPRTPDGSPVIVCYNSFSPTDPSTPDFAVASFVFVSLHAAVHGLEVLFYVAPEQTPYQSPFIKDLPPGCAGGKYKRHEGYTEHHRSCVGLNGCLLHPVWCKVKSAKKALETKPNAPFVIWFDTDVIVRMEDFEKPFVSDLFRMLHKRGLPLEEKPFVANQERNSAWRNRIVQATHVPPWNVTYRWGINTGVWMVANTPSGRRVVDTWWNSSMDSYDSDPLRHRFRTDWPWEQDRLMALANEPRKGVYDLIQVLPDKENLTQADWKESQHRPGTCFGGIALNRCLIMHFSDGLERKTFWGVRIMHTALSLINSCVSGNNSLTMAYAKIAPAAVPPAYPYSQTYSPRAFDNWCWTKANGSAPFREAMRILNFTAPGDEAQLFNNSAHYASFFYLLRRAAAEFSVASVRLLH
ncbi:hypothetical protein DIPPA_09055 [Diplonema papillatum]|nr:hypothetical protein DIPPA_09055 [Diplonema papillatum]